MEKYAFYTFKNFDSRIIKIGYSDNHVSSISLALEIDEKNETTDFTDQVYLQLSEYFGGIRKSFDLPLLLHGTEFQKKVWNALCQIPYGQTRTYKQIAEYIDNPKACRAVGMANNKNPLMIVVPCHRVIGSNGSLTGYAGGLDIKEELLSIEKSPKPLQSKA